MSAHAPRPPSPRGRWVRRIRGLVSGPSIVPPAPRASAVVDPRIGDLGPALLALEDGTVFPGVAFGAAVAAGGDLVVNTSQTGYQEVCTDPSYAGQVVVMTYPLIGNYGRLVADDQSIRPWLRALVVANATAAVLDDARQLAALLRDNAHPGDRRRRHPGAGPPPARERLPARDRDRARRDRSGRRAGPRPRAVPRWEDQDFVGQVSPPAITEYRGPGRRPARGSGSSTSASRTNIVRAMRRRGARVRVFPHTASRVGGPRRPTSTASSSRPVPAIRPGSRRRWRWPARSSTTAGRCSGSASATRSSARAAGADTRRLRFGHHGANHPVQRPRARASSRSPPRTTRSRSSATRCRPRSGFRVSQVNLNDGSVEGLRHRELPIETVQYHPEGAPGPLDALAVFDRFVAARRAVTRPA